jgi:hypothetical protein
VSRAIRLVFKTPGAVEDVVREFVDQEMEEMGLTGLERDEYRDARVEQLERRLGRWFDYGELARITFHLADDQSLDIAVVDR